jgi:hypothetical protein
MRGLIVEVLENGKGLLGGAIQGVIYVQLRSVVCEAPIRPCLSWYVG